MWALDSHQLRCGPQLWARDKEGVHWWIVAAQGNSFDRLRDLQGRAVLSDVRPPPVLAPGTSATRVRRACASTPTSWRPSPASTSLAIAHAHAPAAGRRPPSPSPARRRGCSGRLLVHGERTYDSLGVGLSAHERFTTHPIRYEYAFGGFDTADPDPPQRMDDRSRSAAASCAGRRLRRRPARAPWSNIDGDPEARGPAGFGPVDPSWSPRRELAGTYDACWEQTRRPLLPADYDPELRHERPRRPARPRARPRRARPGSLNMTPEGLLASTSRASPSASPPASARAGRSSPRSLTALILEPEERRLARVAELPAPATALDADYLDVTEIREQRGAA